MKRIRIVGLCLTAMFALCAVAAASASAHHFNVEGKEVKGTEEFEVKGTSGVSNLKGMILGVEVRIICKKDKFTGTLEKEGKTKGTVLFEECEIENATTKEKLTNCKVTNIEFKFKDKLVELNAKIADEFEPSAGTTFVEIEITGASCTLKGKYPVTGTQVCELPKGEEELVVHEIVCTPAGSHLELAKKAATFESTEKVELTKTTGTKLWSAKK